MSHTFVIEDDAHADFVGEFNSYAKAVAEIKSLARIPFGEEPNIIPCSNPNCARNYYIVEMDGSSVVKRELVLVVRSESRELKI